MSEAAASDDAAWRADIVARALGVLQHLLAQEVLAETVLVHASGSRLLHKLVELAATPLPLPALPRSGLLQEMNASANRTLLWTSQACGLAGPAVAERFDETKSIVRRNLGRVGGGKYDVAHVRMHALGASLAWQRHPTPPPAHLALCLALQYKARDKIHSAKARIHGLDLPSTLASHSVPAVDLSYTYCDAHPSRQ